MNALVIMAIGLSVLSLVSGMLGLGVAFSAVPFLGLFLPDLVHQGVNALYGLLQVALSSKLAGGELFLDLSELELQGRQVLGQFFVQGQGDRLALAFLGIHEFGVEVLELALGLLERRLRLFTFADIFDHRPDVTLAVGAAFLLWTTS